MNTPIADFIKKYAQSGAIRLHMPGHKGDGDISAHDITEIDGADLLYHSKGIIRGSQNNAASLFGTKRTLYSTQGSSLSIRAALYLASVYAKEIAKQSVIAAGRNAHRSFIDGVALLDLNVRWLCNEDDRGAVSCTLKARDVEAAFDCEKPPAAVYITSPDYLGNMCDISSIAELCHRNSALLIVDNAHGAYLNFLEKSRHPIALGADICCDSAHKTLPVLTGGGYLHISENAPRSVIENCDFAMSLFASTSPSYLILESLDLANKYLEAGYKEALSRLCYRISGLKKRLSDAGFILIGDEPIKLTVAPKSYGYTGEYLLEYLGKAGMVCEFADRDFCVMMFTEKNTEAQIELLGNTLLSLPKRPPIDEVPPKVHIPPIGMSPREATLTPSEIIPVTESLGRILAGVTAFCPPAVPVAVSGEIVDSETAEAFKYYGIDTVRVVAKKI